ncbi:MAG: RNA polymerase-associated protein rapA [Gammaproteobacteria bacterium]|nr:MAG: RNA polymerase-associated protein rapA [Gammaproteobacteria bacterium]
MFRRTVLSQAILAGLFLPLAAQAEISVKGTVANRTAGFVQAGQTIGQAENMLDDSGHSVGQLNMFENGLRLFLDGDLMPDLSWHLDLQGIYDTEGVNNYWRGPENYTQYEILREAYIDYSLAGWGLRLGKQQVVWGTADGIKLLDVINPTDYRHFVQDSMEDSRIPMWMANIERNMGDAGSVQFIASQAEPNVIPGLDANGDSGQPFVMQGVDAITGQVNGFLNLVPALGSTAQSFTNAAIGGAFTGGMINPYGLLPFAGLTVDGFASGYWDTSTPGLINPGDPTTGTPGAVLLNGITQNGLFPGDPNGNDFITRLLNIYGTSPSDVVWNVSQPTATFDHMPNATFATFNTFSSAQVTGASARSDYVKDKPDWEELNYGFRYKNKTAGGFNYSLNYLYQYDPNPYIDLSWHDAKTGEELQVQRATGMAIPFGNQTVIIPDLQTNLSPDQVPNSALNPLANPTILLRNGQGQYYGAVDPTFGMMPGAHNTNPVELRFTEKLQRIHNLGASFDYALDTEALGPIVLRGEFLYQIDVMQPVIDKRLLGIGDLSNGLVMEAGDMFKYVLGADITLLTNMMASLQFIQFINLDYVDEGRICTTQSGLHYDCSRYTGDTAVLNVTNSLQSGEEFKEFYSLFFSKPFGPAQQHRWNNLTMYEENGGWWNRFDVEYSVTDNFIVSAAWNQYWGDFETQFGQMKESSNLGIGLKYIF